MGVLKSDEEEWRGVLRKQGLDEWNEAGEKLLYTALWSESADSNEYLVPEEGHLLWHLDASSHKAVHMIDLMLMRAARGYAAGMYR